MSIFKYLTLSHLQKVLAALEVRFTGVENEIEEINEININTSSRLNDIENNIPLPYNNLPNADFNNGTMGSSDLYARGDHRHPSDPSKANVSDVLIKTNTIQYLPTNDYNPATKKYVDDATAGITTNLSGLTDIIITSPSDGQILQYNSTTSKWVNGDIPSSLFVVNITSSGSGSNITYSANKTYNETRNAYFNNKECIAVYNNKIYNLIQASNSGTIEFSYCLSANTNVAVETISIASNNYVTLCHDNVYPATYVDYFEQGITKINSDYHKATNSYESGDLFWKKSYSSTGLDPWVLAKATTNISVNDELTFNVNFTTTTIEDELGLKSSITEVLTKTNTTSYTPTTDYHPATKKYVDDSIGGFSADLSGLSDTSISSPSDGQLLKYNATTSKWENVTVSLAISGNTIQLKEGNTVISSITLPVYNGGVSS